MFPLVAIYFFDLVSGRKAGFYYALLLSGVGLAIAIYHNLLYFGVIADAIVPCDEGGVSCAAKQIEWFGFITIPLMALMAFVTQIVVSILGISSLRKEKAQ